MYTSILTSFVPACVYSCKLKQCPHFKPCLFIHSHILTLSDTKYAGHIRSQHGIKIRCWLLITVNITNNRVQKNWVLNFLHMILFQDCQFWHCEVSLWLCCLKYWSGTKTSAWHLAKRETMENREAHVWLPSLVWKRQEGFYSCGLEVTQKEMLLRQKNTETKILIVHFLYDNMFVSLCLYIERYILHFALPT